jgi:hypothetical protein
VRSRTTAAGALLALLVGGCSSSGDKPQSLPAVTSSATPSASAVAAVIPAAARPATALGAAAFVKYWFQLLDQAYRTGKTFPVDELSDANCMTCRNFSGVADDLLRDGYHFAGPSFTGIDVEAPPVDKGLSYVTLLCDLPARQKVDKDGKVIASYPKEKRLVLTVVAQRRGDGWVIRAMKTES